METSSGTADDEQVSPEGGTDQSVSHINTCSKVSISDTHSMIYKGQVIRDKI